MDKPSVARSSASHDNDHHMAVLAQVARLFRAFPAGKNVDEHTLQDYCEAFAAFSIEIVAEVVDRFRLGQVKRKSHDFPPALAEIIIHMRQKQALDKALASGEEARRTRDYILPENHFLNRSKQLSDQSSKSNKENS